VASDGSLGPAQSSLADPARDIGARPDATLHAWRERGDDRLDPIAFHVIEALARRAADQHGAVQQRLDERLAQLIQAYADRLPQLATPHLADPHLAAPNQAAPQAQATPRPRGPLAELAAFLAYPGEPGDDPDAAAAQARRDAYPDLPALDYFREVWSGLSADRQVRQSQEQVHKNAGPLNSNQLVHRALSLMRELSPGYLQQFVAYTETLTWMEQVTAARL